MQNYYNILRLNLEKDIQGKGEADIQQKIESNYKALVSRAPQMYPTQPLRDQMLKEIEAARTILSNKEKRTIYDKQLQMDIAKRKNSQVKITITQLSEEDMAAMAEEERE